MLTLSKMYLLKLANRNLKVLLSVGGYTYSQDGHFDFVTDASLRAAFVNSSTSYIENFGLDGIDIDFEYANTPALAAGFADLLTEMRTAFDALAQKKGDSTTYQLTVRPDRFFCICILIAFLDCCPCWLRQLPVLQRPADECCGHLLEFDGVRLCRLVAQHHCQSS